MIAYEQLSIPLRCIVILCFFLLVCIGGWLIPRIFHRKKFQAKILLFLMTFGCVVPMIIYVAEARANLRNLSVPPISQ